MGKFEIILASAPDRERMVAEIYYNNMYWVEISQEDENGPFKIQFYAHPTNVCWEFSCEEALGTIMRAKQSLEDLDKPSEQKKIWDLP